MTNKLLIIIGLSLTALISLHLFEGVSFKLPVIDALERQAYDFRINLSASPERDDRVVIIDIDERSIKEVGQWPWRRAVFGKLNDQLFDQYGIEALGYDVTFPEPETSFSNQQIRDLAQQTNSTSELVSELEEISGDKIMAESFEGRAIVLGSAFQLQKANRKDSPSVGVLPEPMFETSDIPYPVLLQETQAPIMQRYTGNIPLLSESAMGIGFFSIAETIGDPDGIIRRVELLNRYKDKLYPSLALQLVKSYTFDDPEPILTEQVKDANAGLETLRMMLADIPLDPATTVNVSYRQPEKGYEYVPAIDVLTGTYEGDLTGAIALIGTSASGLVDLRNTPVAAGLPGVEVHANIVSGLLDGKFRVKPGWVSTIDFFVITLFGLIMTFIFPRLSAFWSTVVFVTVSIATIWVNWYFWSSKLVILTIAPMLFLLTSLFFMNMIIGFFSESQARRSTEKMFGMYVPPEVVGEISESEDIFSMKPIKRELTVLFADIRSFTTISEGMDPEALSEWLNDFLTPMTKIIHQNGGAIDKYMGDAIMAFWGAPIEDPNHAENGVKAGIGMIAALDDLNAEFREKGWPEVNIGVGLNTGMMSVGNMGSEFRMAYTVLGDAVNLGSRLEGQTKEYGVNIIVSEFTREKAPNFNYKELDTVKVKGKNKAVTIYSCEAGEPSQEDNQSVETVS